MNQSVDRTNPSGRNPNSFRREREVNIPFSVSTAALKNSQSKIGFQKRKSLPKISVNDEPIRNRRESLVGAYNASTPVNKHIHSHDYGESDLTSASSGTFSECMFESAPKIGTGTSTRSSSSTSSTHTKPDLIDMEYLRRNSSSQSSSYRNKRRYSQNAINCGWHNGKRQSARSYSSSLAPDRKRLVNQFLRSVDPLSSNDSTAVREDSSATIIAPSGVDYDIDLSGKGSLQDFLYRDLEQLPRDATFKPPQPPAAGISGSPSTSSTSSYSFVPRENVSSSSSSVGGSEESYVPPELDMNSVVYDVNEPLYLNCNDLDYCTRHVATQLHSFEKIIKQNLKDIIINDEYTFQKNLKAFDSLTVELRKSKQQLLQVYGSIKNKNLTTLRREFDEIEQDTFMSRTNIVMEANVRHLENLEDRIEVSKKKLVQQRETLRKMQSLLTLKDDMLASQRNTKLAYQYRYMAFDFGVFVILLFVFVLTRWLL